MSDDISGMKFVANRLDAAGIGYMITGSIAASVYAEPRFTRDVDIVVEVAPADSQRLAQLFADDFFVDDEAIARAVKRRSIVNIIHRQLLVKVDFIVRKDTPYRIEEFRRRRAVDIDGVSVSLVTPEDLVLSKLAWMKDSGSEVQRRDVGRLLQMVPNLDRVYIERWAADLVVSELWREVSS